MSELTAPVGLTDPTVGHVTVIGAGHAAAHLATALRSEGFTGGIRLIGDEPQLPYQRPPLSKKLLAGAVDIDSVTLMLREVYTNGHIDLVLGNRVVAIDRAAKAVRLTNGQSLPYDRLVLATGTRARALPVPGATLRNVLSLRTIDDCQALQQRLSPGHRLAVIGGGYIGLEVAATAIGRGCTVTVIEALPRLMARVATPRISEHFARLHRAHGVDLRLATGVTSITGAETAEAVVLADGGQIAADTVLVGIGAVANDELAQAAGLATANGIVVDAMMRTMDPDILAIGDVAKHPNAFAGQALRLESVQNAVDQAQTAALTLVGRSANYDKVPWFWSDQYDETLQIAGLPHNDHDLIIRQHSDPRKFAVFHLSGGRLRAVEAVNASKDYMIGRRLMEQHGGQVQFARLADPAAGLKDLIVN